MHIVDPTEKLEMLPDGTVSVRMGTQMNCAGIAAARLRIARRSEAGVCVASGEGVRDLESWVLDALAEGAQKACLTAEWSDGLAIEVVDALVHEVDGRPWRFRQVAELAVLCWVALRSLEPSS